MTRRIVWQLAPWSIDAGRDCGGAAAAGAADEPEGSAQVQVLGTWTKPARPAFTLGRETYEGGKWIEIKYGRPLQRGRDLFGSGAELRQGRQRRRRARIPARRRCGAPARTSRRG